MLARYQLTWLYNYLRKFEVSEKELRKVIRKNPFLRNTHRELARGYLIWLEPDQALVGIENNLNESNLLHEGNG